MVGMSRALAERIAAARQGGRFTSIDDLARRAAVGGAALELLADADALASLAPDRRTALWAALDHPARDEPLPLFADEQPEEPCVDLPPLPAEAQVLADYGTAGLSLRGHPLQFYREALAALGVTPAVELRQGEADRPVCVAGVVLMRQRPSTAKGITFITLEDETGTANLVVRTSVWERYYVVARRSTALVAWGILERKGEVIHVVVRRLADLGDHLAEQGSAPPTHADQLAVKSRDFR